MFVTRGDSEFEVSISMRDGEWEGKIVESNLSRLVPPRLLQSLACSGAGSASFRMKPTRTGLIFRRLLSSPCRPCTRAVLWTTPIQISVTAERGHYDRSDDGDVSPAQR